MVSAARRWWRAFCDSYDTNELILKSRPASVLIAWAVPVACFLATAYVDPLASVASMRLPLLPPAMFTAGALVSTFFWLTGGRLPFLTLLDMTLYQSAISVCVGLTEPPVSYGYASVYCLLVAAVWARDFGLTPLFSAVLVLQPLIVMVLTADSMALIIAAVGVGLGLWVSHRTAVRRSATMSPDDERRRVLTWPAVLRALRWQNQWRSFCASYNPAAVLARSSPARAVIVLGGEVIAIGGPAFLDPLAATVRMRHPWMPLAAAALAFVTQLLLWRTRGRGNLGPVLTLLSAAFHIGAAVLASALSVTPASHAYGVLVGVFFTAVYGKQFSFTPILILGVCVPSIVAQRLVGGDMIVLFIVCIGFGTGLWASSNTGYHRAWREQNEGLRDALRASTKVAEESIEIALTKTLLGIGSFMHELRNAQATVALGLKYLEAADPSDEEFREALADTLVGHAQTQRLIEKALNDLRPTTAARATTFLIADVLDRTRKDPHGRDRFVVEGSVPNFQVRGDAEQLETVIINLTRNASQAGATRVALQCRLEPSATVVRIEVADNGPGLPPALMPTLFKPFATAAKPGGTGLGLYLARRAVELMGGSIEARNREEGGAVFSISLLGRLSEATPERSRPRGDAVLGPVANRGEAQFLDKAYPPAI